MPPTLKMILKTYYHLPACQAPITSPTVQHDDMVGRHRDGKHNSHERPRASEEEEKVVADGTSSTDKGGDFVSQTEVGTDHEASQIAARHFELAMFWQHQGTTVMSTDWRGYYPIQPDFAGNPNIATTTRVAAREEAAIGRHQRGTTSTDQNKQFDRGGKQGKLLISAKWRCCVLYALLCVFICFAFLTISLVIIPGTEGNKSYSLKMRAIGTRKPEDQLLSWPWGYLDSRFKKHTVVRLLCIEIFLCTLDHGRVTFSA